MGFRNWSSDIPASRGHDSTSIDISSLKIYFSCNPNIDEEISRTYPIAFHDPLTITEL